MRYRKVGRFAARFICLASICVLLGSCKAPDPYEGMVQVPDGTGGLMWITLIEDLDVSIFAPEEFSRDGNFINYIGNGFADYRGIDVSEHQLEIDWEAVRDDGVEFAIIRAGYRGYGEGGLFEDKFFRSNIMGAMDAGIDVGVYFFSQALDTAEAEEEARFLLGLIEGYEISLPVFYDWEPIGNVESARTYGIEDADITGFALAFCDIIESAGYVPGVYFYRSLGYTEYELLRLRGLTFWSAAVGDYPDFYYAHTLWQYSYMGKVSGIETDVDLNILFEKLPEDSGE